MKTRALTEMVYIDEVEVDQEGIADMMLDESSIAQVAREYIIVPAKSFTPQPIKARLFVYSAAQLFQVCSAQLYRDDALMSISPRCLSERYVSPFDLRLFWFGQVQERH